MEKLIQKIRSLTFTLVILAALSLTWLIVDFFILRGYYAENNLTLDANWILIIVSAIPVLLMIVVTFFLSLFVWRLRSKYRSEIRKLEKEQKKLLEESLVKKEEESE